ncbi:MAG TPA: AraC family transcriptional regulator [Candidatus Angelobacter sp.]|nr:AraC family transcriptional regulator [Candidatus Angelobacter sp.]
MKPQFEKLGVNESSFRISERNDPQFQFHWHYHPEYELTLILDSSGQRLVGDGVADYQSGDLVLLGPNLPHSWRSGPFKSGQREQHRAIVVHFREDCFGRHFFELKEMGPVLRLLRASSNGLAFGHTKIGRRVAERLESLPKLSPPHRLIALLSALVALAGIKDPQVLSSFEVQPISHLAGQQRIDAVCGYLDKHYQEPIRFSELAAKFHMDQAFLCRFFRRATGRTLTEYLNGLRVAAAAQLLISTDASVIDICFRVGFGNYSNFTRQFKRIKGLRPRELRSQFQGASAQGMQNPPFVERANPRPHQRRKNAAVLEADIL